MIPILCLVQEGNIERSVVENLKVELTQLTQSALAGEPAISWIEVKRGNGFTEAKPSTSSLVSIQSNRVLSQKERISMMEKICNFWMAETYCSINDIVATVSDPVS